MDSDLKIATLKKEIERLKKLVYIDIVTDVYNRRGFLEIGERYFRSYKENKGRRRKKDITNLAIMFLDIDNFKKINDRYGHQKGDKILRQLAKLLKVTVRKTDLVSRWGGDEFVILLMNVTKKQAQKVALRLRQLVAKNKFLGLSLTISIGLIIPQDEESLAIIINKADKLMYQAKKQGKNQVVM